jgi:hypothetical protein
MPDKLGAEHWRLRAAEVRLEAETVLHPTAKRTLLAMAKTYDQLAAEAESLAANRQAPDNSN